MESLSVSWDEDIFAETVEPLASDGFENVYTWTGSFTEASSTSYSISIEVTPHTGGGSNPWDNFDRANGTVVMNVNNPVVTNASDFARAFDISVKSRKGVADLDPANAVYTDWTTAIAGGWDALGRP